MKLMKLEALRGFASLYVVFHHSLSGLVVIGLPLGYLFKFGQEAVILFFLLSGFVINYAFRKSTNKTFKIFFLKRFTRIYIPLIFVFLLSYTLALMKIGTLLNPNIDTLILNLLMLQDIPSLKPNVIAQPYMNNAPLWSLSYEWWFYIIFFLMYKIFSNKKKSDKIVFFIAIVATIMYLFYPLFIPRILMYLSIWWTGTVLADIYIDKKRFNIINLSMPLLSLLVINLILVTNVIINGYKGLGVHPFLELRHHLFALLVVLISLLWNSINWKGFDLIFGKFLIFAPISYVIYISHYVFFLNKDKLIHISSSLWQFIILFLMIIVFSYIVEKKIYPVIRRKIFERVV